LVLFYLASRFSGKAGMAVLTLLSLGFYTYWMPGQLWILLFSIVFNYTLGSWIQRDRAADRPGRVKTWLWIGLTVDLALLGYFKYTLFVVDNINLFGGTNWDVGQILLPLGISFFTFQKIAWLIDSAWGVAKKTSFLEFSLFAAFFPQLIAGPIVHYKEVIPQFHHRLFGSLIWRNLMVGLVIFAIGLFKKVVIADSIAGYLNPMYDIAAANPGAIDFRTGWLIAVSFTLQVYFDFSGYSDMAIGLARMFGILLPLNFHSPLRAASIIDYWRRWHMTLQRFIVSYLFQPLSVPLNRFVANRNIDGWTAFGIGIMLPSFITFFILGVWHGAGWGFVAYGLLNAVYVSVNELWREHKKRARKRARKLKLPAPADPGFAERFGYHVLTLCCILVGNMFFRAVTLADGLAILRAMAGLNGFGMTALFDDHAAPMLFGLLAAAALIVAVMPNTQQIMARFRPAVNFATWRHEAPALLRWQWKPDALGIAYIGFLLAVALVLIERGEAIFLYFNF
ncbi:MAG: MBOAT family O-acyltransferase, partial [Polymorphobacter sp.]